MRLQAIPSALLFATAAGLTFSAQAASEADKAPPVEVQAGQADTKMAKPQSQVYKEPGMTQPIPASTPSAAKPITRIAGQDRTRHYHPRDGK